MKISVRVRMKNVNPYVMLIYVVVIDLLVLIAFLIQLITGIIFSTPPLLLVLIWIPPAVIVLFFVLFAVAGLFKAHSRRRATPVRSRLHTEIAPSSTSSKAMSEDCLQ